MVEWIAAALAGVALFVGLRRRTSSTVIPASFVPQRSGTTAPDASAPTYSDRELLSLIFERVGVEIGVDPEILKGIAWHESRWNPRAANPADPSYGIMQVLCSGSGERCTNRLPAFPDWPPRRDDLYNPETCIRWGARIYAENLRYFGGDVERAIVGYNNWSAAVGGRPWTQSAARYATAVLANVESRPWAR